MKNSLLKSRLFVASTIIFALIIIGGCINLAIVQLPTDAKNSCSVSNTEFASWFESGVVSKDGVVKPANSITFSDNPNCDFYKWSEQMFLWLTSPTPPRYGGGGGRIFNSPSFYDVSPLVNGERTFIPHPTGGIISTRQSIQLRTSPLGPQKLPIVFERKSRKMFEVEPPRFGKNGKQLISNNEGAHVEINEIKLNADKQPTFFEISGKQILGAKPILRENLNPESTIQKFTTKEVIVFLDAEGRSIDVDPGQAGGLNVLMSQQGSLVYFQITVNDTYAYFKTGVTNGVITSNQFPTTQNELNDISNFASANGKTLVDPEALAIEIKTSWVEASTLPTNELSRFITINTSVPTYDTSNPNEWVPNGQKNAKLAMIGMHVVGSANGHPEMIWATFEHVSAAPNSAYSYINSSNSAVTIPQTTNGNWILCASNATIPFNDPYMGVNFTTGSIEPITPHLISPSNTIRDHAWGASPTQRPNPLVPTTAHSNSDIISINNSIRTQLMPGDVRAEYIMTGSTWTIGGGAPTGPFTTTPSLGKEVGTSRLANTSMETYVQAINCFSCHTTNTVNVSAVWSDLKPLFP